MTKKARIRALQEGTSGNALLQEYLEHPLTMSAVDGQIAAIARVNQLILVTRNVVEYDDFSGLDLQNRHEWTAFSFSRIQML